MVKHRKAKRYRLGLKGVFHHARESGGANVVVRDISTHGCELEHAQGSINGEKCELYFDWQGAQVGLEAQVVWKDAKGRAGLKFLRVDKESQRRVNELCDTLSRQAPSAPPQKEAHAAHHLADPTQGPRVARPTTSLQAPQPLPVHRESDRSRRLVPRYVSELRGCLLNPATDATTHVTVVSLSILGASLQGSPLPDNGQTCELQTEWEGNPFVLRCDVVWKTQEQAGVRFRSVDEETGKLLRRTCTNLRLQPPGPSLP
ncbi:MAG TPA: PilZ domain-containing protein [Terriglobia bacterium]|nr:PilZ domain-containing protein [Terriglobia bacterium]